MPISKAPYKRSYKHTKTRGSETGVRCDRCGRLVPRWKTFTTRKGFRIRDPVILRQVDRRFIHLLSRTQRVCPKCARFYGVVQRGKSVQKKHMARR